MGILNDLSLFVARLPLEKWLFRGPNRVEQLERMEKAIGLQQTASIVGEAVAREAAIETIAIGDAEQHPESILERLETVSPKHPLTTEETVSYQKREISKQLLAMESHYSQRMKIRGVPCDCGSSKHLLFLEQLSQETIPMVNDPSIYEEIIAWVRENEPKSTEEAARSGKYDDEYPVLSGQARDFRKNLMGSLSLAPMIEPQDQITLEEAKAEAAKVAAEEIEKAWEEERWTKEDEW